ncbi:MAG: ATP-binding cassette domain-containing protein, partial [Burkholderiales bacterium]
MPAENLVEIENVTFAYDQRTILDGISLNVLRGNVVAIMGGSGCGKTTTLRLIAGALRPSAGDVKVGDQIVNRLSNDALYALRRKM